MRIHNRQIRIHKWKSTIRKVFVALQQSTTLMCHCAYIILYKNTEYKNSNYVTIRKASNLVEDIPKFRFVISGYLSSLTCSSILAAKTKKKRKKMWDTQMWLSYCFITQKQRNLTVKRCHTSWRANNRTSTRSFTSQILYTSKKARRMQYQLIINTILSNISHATFY